MLDLLQRPLGDLRISVTDRCNLRCPYCMPRAAFGPDFAFLTESDMLDFDEITRLTRAFVANGVRKLRLTGGEPLLRAGLEELVARLRELAGVHEIALTSNGLLLARKASALKRAGLDRVTVSLDALDAQAFQRMTDAPLSPARVLDAIAAALDAGLAPVKVNMVVRRGVNDHCVAEMAERFRGQPRIVLRFIEYMDVGTTNGWRPDDVVPAGEILSLIHRRWPLQRLARAHPAEVASRYRYLDGAGEIGVIHSVSEPFCRGCTRARLSADGKLFTCLFARRGTDLRALLRGGATDLQLARAVGEAWRRRGDRYSELRSAGGRRAGARRDAPEMSYIGG